MVGFAEAYTCRRRVLLGYFGEQLDHDCGNCDICLDPPETLRRHRARADGAVLRVPGGAALRHRHVIDVLRGSENEKVISRGHDQLSTFGIGQDLSRDAWQSLIRQLIHRGYLIQDIARYSVLKLTPAARALLRGDEMLVLAKPRTRLPSAKERRAAERAARAAGLADLEVDESLFRHLRALRKRLADEQRVPAYVVFSDATLAEMAARKPGTYVDLLDVTGVGRAKLERYGDAFLDAIAEYESRRG